MLTGVKVIVTAHGLDITFSAPVYRSLVPLCVKKLDRVVCVSRNTRDLCIEKGVSEKRCTVIPNAVNAPSPVLDAGITEQEKDLLSRIEKELSSGKALLLSVGRLVPRKGIRQFLENIYPRLSERFVYVHAGEGKERNSLKLFSEKEGYGSVYFPGRVSDRLLEDLYKKAGVFIMPNIRVKRDPEGFGLVAAEASVRGVPVVAFDVDGIADAVDHGITGWLVKPGDVSVFTEKITQPGLRREDVARGARKYTWRRTGEIYADLIRSEVPARSVTVFSVTMAPLGRSFDDGPRNIVFTTARESPGYRFIMVGTFSPPAERPYNLVVIRSPFQSGGTHSMPAAQKLFVFIAMLVNMPRVDIYQFFFTPTRLFAGICGGLLRITGKHPLQVVSSVRTLKSRTRGDIRGLFFSNPVVTQSASAAVFLRKRGISSVRRVYPGIDLGRFDPDNAGNFDGLGKDGPNILYPGNYSLMAQAYTFGCFFEIVKAIKADLPRVVFVMACRIRTPADAELEKKFAEKAESLGLAESFIRMNTVCDMPALMNSCQMGFLPAETEMVRVLEVPMVIPEMAALKKPFVYGRIEQLEEIRKMGLGACPDDNTPVAYAALIKNILSDRARRQEVIASSREAVERYFDIRGTASEYRQIYDELVTGSRSS
jgi:phosphatidylinositol alpha-1,6-mannosyltransferase